MDPVVKTLIKRRLKLGLSQLVLAQRAGTTQSAISNIETGFTSPTIYTLRKLFVSLGLVMDLKELDGIDHEVAYLRSLTPEELERELVSRRWYAHPNDLIGGWCAMPIDASPSSGCFSIADFMSEEQARHIVDLHNKNVVTDDRDPDCIERWPDCFRGLFDPRCCRFPKSCSC